MSKELQKAVHALLIDKSSEAEALFEKARSLILAVRPGCHQEVETSWGGYLLFKQVKEAGSAVCFLSAHSKHVSLGFAEGTLLADPDGLLQGSGKRQRHVKLRKLADVDLPALKDLVTAAWAEQPEPEALEVSLERLRELCLSLPGASEKLSHGHPTFFVGKKSFAVYGLYSPSVAFKPSHATAMDLAADERFFPTPYMARNGWMSIKLVGEIDWDEVRALVQESHGEVTGKKR